MAGFKLEVPVDLSEKTTSIIDTAKKILHLVTLLTTVLTICIVVPMLVTEVRYLVSLVKDHKGLNLNGFKIGWRQTSTKLYFIRGYHQFTYSILFSLFSLDVRAPQQI